MKKFLFIILLVFTFGGYSQAQDAYEKGVNYFSAGVGFGNAYNNGYGLGTGLGNSLPLNASFELGIHDYFSVGPYISYATYRPNTVFGTFSDYRANFFSVGGKLSFHYVNLANDALDLGIDPEKLDLYIAAYAGAEFFTDNTEINYANTAQADFGVVIGGRYMFSESFGAYSELGYAALSVFSLGITLNL